MWIRVTTEKKAVHLLQPLSYSYIEGDAVEEYYFDDETAIALEEDGFLIDMWKKNDALIDWGDCDFFPPEKCKILREWLKKRLSQTSSQTLQLIYEVMLDFANKAITNDTGISFDF